MTVAGINDVEAIADEPLTTKEGWRRFVDHQPAPAGAARRGRDGEAVASVTGRPTTMPAAGITPTCRW